MGGMEHIPDTSYWHYALQQNLYRHIVEKCYGLTVSNMNLVILHPSYSSYKVVRVPRLDDEIQLIVNDLRSMHNS